MGTVYNILLFFSLLIATVFGLLVLFTGKGDAMSGGSTSVRTTFKGKASFDDFLSKWTMILGATFFGLMLLIDAVGNRMYNSANSGPVSNVQKGSPSAPPANGGTQTVPAKITHVTTTPSSPPKK